MGIQNSRALLGARPGVARPGVARPAGHSAPKGLQARVNIHGLSGVHVPAGRVKIPTGTHDVPDHFLMNPATKGLVKEWARTDGRTPYIGLAMETARSPHNPGQLHVVQRGVDAHNMELIPEAKMIADYVLDPNQGHLELVGDPIDVLTRYANLQGNPDDVMYSLSFFEQVALAAFLNRVTIGDRAAAHLGAFNMVSEAQIVHAANHPKLFEGSVDLPGMPNCVGHWTRDLYDPSELELPANQRINARRVWRGGSRRDVGALPVPVADRRGSDGSGLRYRGGGDVARFAVLPSLQDSNP